jgi:adenylate cyclase
LEKISDGAFDIVLLDIEMPELDGYGVLEARKSDLSARDIPVIMISAIDEIESIARCITMGAEDYLPKPFNPTLLRARLSASLEKKRFQDERTSYLSEIKEEKKKSENLQNVILPTVIANELKRNSRV